MKQLKFVHCADIHLDAPFTSLGAQSGKSSARRQDLKDTFWRIIEIVKNEKADLLLVSGDLFEQGYVRKSTIQYMNDLFNSISNTYILIIPGNHDPYLANSYYRNFEWSANVHLITEDNPFVQLEALDTFVYGTGFNSYYGDKHAVYGLRPLDKNSFNILLLHGTVDMGFSQESFNPVDSESLEEMGMDYIAMGHFHNTLMGFGMGRTIFNPGSPEPLGFDETGEHGIFVGTLSKNDDGSKKLDMSFEKTNKRYYELVELDIGGLKTEEQILEKIKLSLIEKDLQNGLFSITLKGYIDSELKLDLNMMQERLKEDAFFIKIKDESTADYDLDAIVNEPGLRGLFARKIYELIEKSGDEYRKKLLMKSLYYGLEAIEKGKVEVV